jgi:archaeal type IV pilus assembly protein PilA
MNFGKTIRKFRRNTRAISPVIATLLMIAIAVVASLVTYAWVMGYMNFTTNKTGLAIQIQSVSVTAQTVYVQNVGSGSVSFAAPCVFVDGAAVTVSSPIPTNVAAGTTVSFTIPAFTAGSHTYTIKVTSQDGTFSQIDKNFPS